MPDDTRHFAPHDGSRVPLPGKGVLTPLVTPLLPDRTPDLDSLGRLLDSEIAVGVNGFLVLGSSGEGVALSANERQQVAEHAISHVSSRAHVMLGVSAHGTKDARNEARALDALGPDSLLVAAPAGFALSQTELSGHFRAISQAVSAPVVAYEVPTRVGVSLGAELIAELGRERVIAGVKDSSGNLVAGRMYSEATRALPGFVRYTGCEQCIDAAMLGGYDGAVAGLANVFPRFHVELVQRAVAGDWPGAARVQGAVISLLNLYFHPLANASFSAQFFAVVKESLVQQQIIEHGTTSAPMTEADDGVRQHVTAMLRQADELAHSLGLPELTAVSSR